MNAYTVKQLKYPSDFSMKTMKFCVAAAKHLVTLRPMFMWQHFNIFEYARNFRFVVCYRGSEPVGVMLSRIGSSILDPSLTVLTQDLLYAKPGTRAAYFLLRDYIDFGKRNANHIVTTIGPETRISERSLNKLGFKKIDSAYRIEV